MNIFELLKLSDILKVDGFLLSHWDCDFDVDENETALEFSYTDEIGQIFSFEFTKESLNKATFKDGNALLVDADDYTVEIEFFRLTPVK